MANKLLSTFQDFSLGLNDKVAANILNDMELAESQNCFVGRGIIDKRYGYLPYSTLSATYLYEFFKSNYTSEFLAVSGTSLYKDNGSGTFSSVTMTNALTTSNVRMITYNDRSMNDVVLIADGGKLKTYNGTEVKEVVPYTPTTDELTDPGTNDLANLTQFKTFVIHGERIYACAHPTNRNRISFCHIDPNLGYGVYDYFPATHFFDVAVDDNDEIIQLKVFRDAVIVFCKRSVWALYGNGRTLNDYTLEKINVPTGCIAPNSIIEVGNTIFYLSETHIYSLTSTDQSYISAEVVSERIENTLKGISLTDKTQSVATFFKDKYYLSFPNGTTVVFDNLIANWTVFTNISAKSFLNCSGVLYFAGSKIYKFDENTWSDDGVPIVTRIKFKNMDLGYPVQKKKIRKLWVVAKQYETLSSDYQIKAIVDYFEVDITDISTDESLVWDEGEWDNANWDFKEVIMNKLRIRKSGTNFQLLIINDSLNQPFTFYGFALQFKLKKP
jgi:hypothetical protein